MGIYDQPHEPPVGMWEQRCDRCQQDPCECCRRCGADPLQPCEPWCGFDVPEGMVPEEAVDELT